MYKRSVTAIKQSARLTSVLVRQVHSAENNKDPGGDYGRGATRAFGAGTLAVALLAADHVFNGAYTVTTTYIVVLKTS